MRTTIDLDDALHELVRRRAFEEHRSIGDVVSELARRGLAAERAAAPRRPFGMFAGEIEIADDFDDTPPEVIEAIERAL